VYINLNKTLNTVARNELDINVLTDKMNYHMGLKLTIHEDWMLLGSLNRCMCIMSVAQN